MRLSGAESGDEGWQIGDAYAGAIGGHGGCRFEQVRAMGSPRSDHYQILYACAMIFFFQLRTKD